MTLNIDEIFERKLTCASKNDMRNLAKFHQSTFESLKIGTSTGSFYPKWKMYVLKIYMGVICVMTMKDDSKFDEELTYQFKIDMRN